MAHRPADRRTVRVVKSTVSIMPRYFTRSVYCGEARRGEARSAARDNNSPSKKVGDLDEILPRRLRQLGRSKVVACNKDLSHTRV